MEQIAKIGAYITVPHCATTGAVKNIKEGNGDAIGQEAAVDELYKAIDRSNIIIIGLSKNQSVDTQHNPRAALGKVAVGNSLCPTHGRSLAYPGLASVGLALAPPPPDSRESDSAPCPLPWHRFRPSLTRSTIISRL